MKTAIYELCRWLAVAAAVIFLIMTGITYRTPDTDPQTVMKAVCESADMTNMQKASHQMIKRLYGIDPTDYEFCALYYPLTNMDVDELLVVKYRDLSQAEALQKAVEARLDGQKKVFESYGVGQMELMNRHSFFASRSDFAVFTINPKSYEIRTAFIKALEG